MSEQREKYQCSTDTTEPDPAPATRITSWTCDGCGAQLGTITRAHNRPPRLDVLRDVPFAVDGITPTATCPACGNAQEWYFTAGALDTLVSKYVNRLVARNERFKAMIENA